MWFETANGQCITELRREYQVDTSDLPRWISGEKPRMRVDTWERLKPILEQFAVK